MPEESNASGIHATIGRDLKVITALQILQPEGSIGFLEHVFIYSLYPHEARPAFTFS
jgi:hypothetical protein